MLLIDFLEDAAEYLREKTMKLQELDRQYHRVYDKDIRREMAIIKQEIRRKKAEVTKEILLNLEELRYLKKYFPELLETFMEDDYIGRLISKKAWLLDFKHVHPQEAATRLDELSKSRMQLKDAKKFLNKWVGTVEARAFVATYPVLRGHMKDDMEKDEVFELIDDVDKLLRRKGWLLLINEALIQIPIARFMGKIKKCRYAEMVAKSDSSRANGRGTVAEANAKRNLEKVIRKREHYENVLTQLLLANPAYLREMKKNTNWLARKRPGELEKFAEGIVPRRVKERTWLNEMQKKLGLDEEPEEPEKPRKKASKKKKTPKKKTAKKKKKKK